MYAWYGALAGREDGEEKEILSRRRRVNDRDALSEVKEDHVVSYKRTTVNQSRVSRFVIKARNK